LQTKLEHRNINHTFKLTPETKNCRDVYVSDIYAINKKNYLTCIDLYSKFAAVIEIAGKDWMEIKRALMIVFTNMGKPLKLKTDKDTSFMSNALKEWLDKYNNY